MNRLRDRGMVGAFYALIGSAVRYCPRVSVDTAHRAVMLSAQHTLSALALLLIAMACTKGP